MLMGHVYYISGGGRLCPHIPFLSSYCQGLGSLVWVSCVLERRALMHVWNWGWCVEVFVLEVQSGLGGGPGVYIFAGSV